MESWSLAVSFLALAVSGWSVWFAWQQKEILRKALGIEEKRHADERAPSFGAAIEVHSGGEAEWYRLHRRLDSASSLAKVHVYIADAEGVSFTGSQVGVEAGASTPILAASGGPLQPGEDLVWRVQLDEDRSETVRLRVQSSDNEGRHWTRVVGADVPRFVPPPMIF